MKATLRKTLELEIDMDKLMTHCICLLDHIRRRIERGRYAREYENIESLVQDGLEALFDIEICDYDNAKEIISVVAKNLLLWCIDHMYVEEHYRIEHLY